MSEEDLLGKENKSSNLPKIAGVLSQGTRVKRKTGPSGQGVVASIREETRTGSSLGFKPVSPVGGESAPKGEASEFTDTYESRDGRPDHQPLLVTVEWDNGSTSCVTPEAIEPVR